MDDTQHAALVNTWKPTGVHAHTIVYIHHTQTCIYTPHYIHTLHTHELYTTHCIHYTHAVHANILHTHYTHTCMHACFVYVKITKMVRQEDEF